MLSLIGRIEGQTNGSRDQRSGGSIGRRTDKCTICKMCVKCEFLLYKMLIDLFLNSINIMSYTASIPDQFSSCVRSKCVYVEKSMKFNSKYESYQRFIFIYSVHPLPQPPTPRLRREKKKNNYILQLLKLDPSSFKN